jgi:tRNA pseudouridine13 synthase
MGSTAILLDGTSLGIVQDLLGVAGSGAYVLVSCANGFVMIPRGLTTFESVPRILQVNLTTAQLAELPLLPQLSLLNNQFVGRVHTFFGGPRGRAILQNERRERSPCWIAFEWMADRIRVTSLMAVPAKPRKSIRAVESRVDCRIDCWGRRGLFHSSFILHPSSFPLYTAAMSRDAVLPFLTSALSGIGGSLKERPEDFVVEEVPVYRPTGTGEHLFLWVEKTDVGGMDLVRHIGRALGVSLRDIGTAGVKDRRAVTRQFVSVPARAEERIGRIETDRIRVLSSARHGNKLRTGHLAGNRFSILVRQVDADAAEKARPIAEAISRHGFPNYYGEQRFGRDKETLELGLELLRGQKQPRDIPAPRRSFLLRMALSAVQSALFNDVLAQRLRDGLFSTVLAGDVMQVAASGGPFVVSDAAAEQRRFDARETVLTGPMFGPEMRSPRDEPAGREARVLAAWGLALDDFSRYSKLTAGTRRPLVVWPGELRVASEPEGLRFEFTLPSGVYATTLLREFLKSRAEA